MEDIWTILAPLFLIVGFVGMVYNVRVIRKYFEIEKRK